MVETSRRDFLKLLGIGAAVAVAPNVVIAPEVIAMPTENVSIDKMKLNYFIGNRIYPLGFLDYVSVEFPQEVRVIGNSFPIMRSDPTLTFSVCSDLTERHNFNRVMEEIINPNYGNSPVHRITGQVTSKDVTQRIPKINVIEFNASGIMQEFNDAFVTEQSNTFKSKMKFLYHEVAVRTLH